MKAHPSLSSGSPGWQVGLQTSIAMLGATGFASARPRRNGTGRASGTHQFSFEGALVLLFGLVLAPCEATAQTSWTNPGTGNWTTAANWSAGVPGSTSVALINNGGTANISATSEAATTVTLGANAGDAGTLRIFSLAGTPGTLTLSNQIIVGNSGSSTFIQSGTSLLDGTAAIIGSNDGSSGVASLTGANAAWNLFFGVTVGRAGAGTLTLSSGADIAGLGLFLGDAATGNGAATVTGAGSDWSVYGPIWVGNAGTGSLTIDNGGSVSWVFSTLTGLDAHARIGRSANSVGTVSVVGAGSSWTMHSSSTLFVGDLGMGTLTIADGGAVSAGLVSINALSTLHIGNGGNSGSLATTSITNQGTLNFNHAESLVFSTPVAGAGMISNSGPGSTTINNAPTFNGNLTAQAGLLTVNGPSAPTSLTASSGGVLRINDLTVNLGTNSSRANSSGTIEYSNVAVNGGFLRGSGIHSLVAGTTNSFTGVTTFNSTTIVQDGLGAFNHFTNGGSFFNNAPAQFDGATNASSGNMVVSRQLDALDFTSNGVLAVANGGVLNNVSGNLVAGGGSRTTVDAASAIHLQAGTMELNGASLVNDGTITGTVSVNFGSLAKGSGSFQSMVVNDGGTYSPGNSAAEVTVGALHLASGSAIGSPKLVIELGGTTLGTEYDHITVSELLSLGGVLEISLIDGFNPSAGQTFDILNWGLITGTFSTITLPTLDSLTWNASQLYTTGALSIEAANLAGDYNGNGVVAAADYTVWRDNVGAAAGTLPNDVDGGVIGQAQYETWKANFGATSSDALAAVVPEPSYAPLAIVALLATRIVNRRARPSGLRTAWRSGYQDFESRARLHYLLWISVDE